MNTDRGNNHANEGEQVFGVLIFLGLASLTLPGLIPGLRHVFVRWLLSQGVLLAKPACLFTIPGLGIGPDLRRLLITTLVLVSAALLTTRVRRRPVRA